MTEDKIKEAFEAWWADSGRLMIPDEMEYGLAAIVKEACFVANQAGYMACLNGLVPAGGFITETNDFHVTYRLPE